MTIGTLVFDRWLQPGLLLHVVQRGWLYLAVPNLTTQPSMVTAPITVIALYDV